MFIVFDCVQTQSPSFHMLASDAQKVTSKVILKILEVRLQENMNWELPYTQAEFTKGRETIADGDHSHDIKRRLLLGRKLWQI